MAVYIISGELGSGKTLMAVSRMYDALHAGCRVATNIDLKLEGLVGPHKPRDVIRLPDWPGRVDLDALGRGYEGRQYDEARFGALVLDEAGTFLNSREWSNDKDRMKVIHWLLHARHLRWHIYLIVQSIEMIDKQIRSGLAEHVVKCRRLDRYAVPVLGALTRMMGLGTLKLPQLHLGVVRYGAGLNAPVVDKWMLWNARQFHGAYDTQQAVMGTGCEGSAVYLDQRHAAYLWRPRTLYDRLWEVFGRWLELSASDAMRRHLDFWLWEQGEGVSYKLAPRGYPEWLAARAAHAGPLGGGAAGGGFAGGAAGEAAEPEPVVVSA